MTEELAQLTLEAAAEAVRQRQVSSLEMVEAVLERIDRMEPELNCYISVFADDARQEARALDQRLSDGEDPGALWGIPISVKDNIAVAGHVTSGGSQVLRDWQPARDGAVVVRLRQAGAVVIGKTNLYELGCGGEDAGYGEVAHPLDPRYSCRGSSSGSACAVAAGLSHASIGTDVGGSIRVPAAICGVVGLKPTFGVVSHTGVLPASPSLCHVGPIARTVPDVAKVQQVIVGRDGGAATYGIEASWSEECRRDITGLRIGVLDEKDFGDIDPEIANSVTESYAALRTISQVRAVRLPHLIEARTPMWLIASAEAAAAYGPFFKTVPERFGEALRRRLAQGLEIPAVDYVRAQAARTRMKAELDEAFASVDALVLPATATVARPRGEQMRVTEAGVEDLGVAMGRYTPIFNMTGHPALVVPWSISGGGFPISVQVAAGTGQDLVVLRVGHAIERLRPAPSADAVPVR
jgi:aspartyl-tRNA(Asn)/glutamyl-tRNA(Gln) amidotransferase subunit A